MTEKITEAIGSVSVAVIVQALITLILTIAVVALVAFDRTVPEAIMTAWVVSLGVWIPQPSNKKSP